MYDGVTKDAIAVFCNMLDNIIIFLHIINHSDRISNIIQERIFQMAESEITRLLRSIEQEYEAARNGLSGLASGSAQHAFIERKMERLDVCHRALCGLLGEQEAAKLVVETIERL